MSNSTDNLLPKSINQFVEATKRQDADIICACFTSTAIINDEGIDYQGDGLRKFIEGAFVSSKFILTTKLVIELGARTLVRFEWDGDASAWGIEEPFLLDCYFTMSQNGDKIQHLEITDLLYGKEQMRAVYQSKGDCNDPFKYLKIGKRLVPENIPDDHVLVKISAAGINWHDIFTMKGFNARKKTLSFPRILGVDGAGTLPDGTPVVVYALLGNPEYRGDETLDPDTHVFSEAYYQGAMADYLLTPKRNVVPLPKGMSPVTAAALGTAWLTAYRMIWPTSKLRPGQTMLVQGATGGVTTALIQMGWAAGIIVWATGRTEEKRHFALKLGAHRVFSPGETLPEPVHAVMDTSGAATFKHSMDSVRIGGTIVTVGLHSGTNPPLDLLRVFKDQVDIKGVQAGTLEEFKDLISFVQSTGIEPAIGKLLPFDKAEEGLKDLDEGTTFGKIVIKF